MNNQFPSAQTLQEEDTNQIGKKQKGTGFTNISRILKANVGAGERMGAQIGAGIGSRAKSLQEQTQAGAQQFRGQYGSARGKALEDIGKVGNIVGQVDESGYVAPVTPMPAAQVEQPPMPGVVPQGRVLSGKDAIEFRDGVPYMGGMPYRPPYMPSPIQIGRTVPTLEEQPKTLLPQPSTIASMTEEQAGELGKAFDLAKYAGPKGISGAEDLAGQAQSLSRFSDYARRGAFGTQNLLRSMAYGQTPYTKGQSLLDAALLGQSKAGQMAIAKGAQEAQQAAAETGQQTGVAEQLAKTAQEQIDAEKEKVAGAGLGKIAAIKGSGEQAAKSLFGEAKELKDLLSGTTKLVSEEEAKADPKKQLEREKQIDMLSNLSKYGISDTASVYGLDETAMSNLLKTIAEPGKTEAAGAMKFTDAQKNALKILAKLGKDEAAKKLSETTDLASPWKTDASDIEKQSLAKYGIADKEATLKDIDKGNKYKKYVEEMTRLAGRGEFAPGYGRFLELSDIYAKSLGLDPQEVRDLSAKNYVMVGPRTWTGGKLFGDLANKLTEKQSIMQSKTNLRDYIKKKFGIK